ncbi:hypothetical protein [Polycyclovorans algicola]|uniref:hypothetical protein n=1 Tax=Polycyclovorans algicola TaxID=616992 RepID=UPI0004A73FF4|nr:hypothetical protein [Polycyclovorans algicola]
MRTLQCHIKGLAAACLLAFASAAPAGASQADDNARVLADIASAALALEQAIAQQPGAMGLAAPFNVYLRTLPNGLRLHSVTATWGTSSTHQVELNHQTAEALRSGAVFALPIPLSEAGMQPLRVEILASRMVSGARIARLRLTYSGDVEVGTTGRHIELVLQQEGLRNRHTLTLAETPSSERSLRIGVAEMLLATGHPYRAAAELAALNGVQTDVDAASAGAALLARAQQALHIEAGHAASGDANAASIAGRYAHARRLLRDGLRDEALTALKAVTELTDDSPAARAMRDRANLALAEQALYAGHGDEATQRFEKVHSPGPYASRALLGLGWSYLLSGSVAAGVDQAGTLVAAPRLEATASLRPASADETAELRRMSPFRYADAVIRGPRQDRLQQALTVWQELIGRDPGDPAVQEGMLAMAYAFAHLGAHEQAVQRYQRALDQMLTMRSHLGDAMRHVESGALVSAMRQHDASATSDWSWWLLERRDARWWMSEDVDAAPLFYVEHLLERDDFRQTLGDFQNLQSIAARLFQLAADAPQGLQPRIAALQQRVGAALDRFEAQIETLALGQLAQQRTTTETYVAEAHLALARMYDRPAEPAQPYLEAVTP